MRRVHERERERVKRERERKEVKREREGGDKEKGEREKGNIETLKINMRDKGNIEKLKINIENQTPHTRHHTPRLLDSFVNRCITIVFISYGNKA